jgi:hypothetical protein
MAANEKSRNLGQSNRLTREPPGYVVPKTLQRYEALLQPFFP